MQWKPNTTVAAIVCRDDRFLIVEEEIEGRVVINQPAGHLEEHESPAQAVQREVAEETGYEFEPQFITGVYFYRSPDNGITYLRFCFAGPCSERPHEGPLDQGIIRATWMTRAQLQSSTGKHRSPLVLRCIDDYLSDRQFPLDMIARVQ
jgi:8-oxo-dGTP pyrophosphatase MutT (NUDIX family)